MLANDGGKSSEMIEMAHNPTVSVVLPTYNRAHILGKAIQTVLNQTYKDFEFIIVDDGSTDSTGEVVKAFTDERIRYVRHDNNRGEAAARNTGISIARGKYIAWQDDDSEWLPDKLEKQTKAIEGARPTVGVVYTGMWRIADGEKTYLPPSYVTEKEGHIHKQILRAYFIGHPHVLVKKECYENIGLYNEALPAGLDWDMWIRVSRDYEFKIIDEPLVTTYYLSANTYYDQIAWAKGYLSILDNYYQEFKQTDRKLLAKRYFSYGLVLSRGKDPRQFTEGRRYLWKAFRLSPLRPNYALASFASLFGRAVLRFSPLSVVVRTFNRLYPLIDRLRPFLGWAYPALNRAARFFLKIALGD